MDRSHGPPAWFLPLRLHQPQLWSPVSRLLPRAENPAEKHGFQAIAPASFLPARRAGVALEPTGLRVTCGSCGPARRISFHSLAPEMENRSAHIFRNCRILRRSDLFRFALSFFPQPNSAAIASTLR